MRSSFGRQIQYALFGESHGEGVGITIQHLPAGLEIDMNQIKQALDRRRPGTGLHTTPRQETDYFKVLSGMYQDRLTGAPLTIFFPNRDTRSKDYKSLVQVPRPSHADYVANAKFMGFNDPRGGGHFSGRLTAPLVFAGAIAEQILAEEGVCIVGHALQVGDVKDMALAEVTQRAGPSLKRLIAQTPVPMVDKLKAKEALEAIETARLALDSLGGMIEIMVTGIPVGWGEPFFDSVESQLAHLLFSVPGVKSLAFGAGEAFAQMRGSQANDPWQIHDGKVTTQKNDSGGINGGITNGMPIHFRVALRPTPSIALKQESINLSKGIAEPLTISGRHDPCIVTRACVVIEAVTAMALLELKYEYQIQKGGRNNERT